MSNSEIPDYQPVERHRRADRRRLEENPGTNADINPDLTADSKAPDEETASPAEPVSTFDSESLRPGGESLPSYDQSDDEQPPRQSASRPVYSSYDPEALEEQRRTALRQPPQSTNMYTRMTETGYQQVIRQEARPSYQRLQPAKVTLEQEEDLSKDDSYAQPARTNVRPERQDDIYAERMSRRSQMRDEEEEEEEEENSRTPTWRILLIALIFLVILFFGGMFLLPEGSDGIIGKLNTIKAKLFPSFATVSATQAPTDVPTAEPVITDAPVVTAAPTVQPVSVVEEPSAVEFKCTCASGAVPTSCTFNLRTTGDVEEVCLVDEYNDELLCDITRLDDGNGTETVWQFAYTASAPFTGTIYPSMKTSSGEWVRDVQGISVNFYSVATPTPQPEVTEAPLSGSNEASFVLPDTGSNAAEEDFSDEDDEEEPSFDESDDEFDDESEYGDDYDDEYAGDEDFDDYDDFDDIDWDEDEDDELIDEEDWDGQDDGWYYGDEDEQTEELAEEDVQPTPEPTATPTAVPLPTVAPTAAVVTATPMPVLTASSEASSLKMTDTVYIGGKTQSDYQRTTKLNAQSPDQYASWKGGVLTFRGDNFRRNAAFGTVEISEQVMEILWEYEMGSLKTADSTLYGVGWTGQPAIVKWSQEVREIMNLYDDKKNVTALKEVIVAGQDGKVHFVDLKDGQPTRDVINIGYPLRGSVSVDSKARPMISFGQSISKMPNKTGAIGYYLYNLIDCSQLMFINGRKSDNQKQYNTNGSFDGSGLFLWNTDTMVIAGENGLLYTVDLNCSFSLTEKSLTVTPSTVYLKSKANSAKDTQTSVESSVAMYGQYIFLADSYGALRCVDSTTMKTVWALDNGDNTDATIALDFDEDGTLWLYTGSTSGSRVGSKKDVTIRRVNAMTGETDWTYGIRCTADTKTEYSGCKASPVVGENSISDLVYFTVTNLKEGGSKLIALEKSTGNVRWEYAMDANAVSSPVAVYNAAGDAWIIQADMKGVMYLLDARSGALLNTLDLGGQVLGSPAVYNDILVIGTSSKGNAKLYGIQLK